MSIVNLGAISAVAFALTAVGTAILGAVIGFVVYHFVTKKKLVNSKSNAVKIIEEAYAEAKTAKKEAILEAKEEVHKLRSEFDQEQKDRRAELQRQEERLSQREDFIEKKELGLDKKQEQIDEMKEALNNRSAEIDKIKDEHPSGFVRTPGLGLKITYKIYEEEPV